MASRLLLCLVILLISSVSIAQNPRQLFTTEAEKEAAVKLFKERLETNQDLTPETRKQMLDRFKSQIGYEQSVTPKQTPQAAPIVDSTQPDEPPKPKKEVYGASLQYLSYVDLVEDSSTSSPGGLVTLQYDIEPSIWVVLEGKYEFAKDLHGALNLKFDSESFNKGLEIFAFLATENWHYRARFGKLEGSFSETTKNTSGVIQNKSEEKVDTKFLSIEALNGNLGSSIYWGFRLVENELPAVLDGNVVSDALTNEEVSESGLDPKLKVRGLEFVFKIDNFRGKFEDKDYKYKEWDHGGSFTLAAGAGTATISDIGKANFERANGDNPLTKTEHTILLSDYDLEYMIFKRGKFMSGEYFLGFGYYASLSFHVTPFIDDDLDLEGIFPTYVQHGPTLRFISRF